MPHTHGWMAEQVKFSELIPNSPFYLTNPLVELPAGRFHAVHYTGTLELEPDALVWTAYESWYNYNPWIRRAVRGEAPKSDHIGSAAGGLINTFDDYLR